MFDTDIHLNFILITFPSLRTDRLKIDLIILILILTQINLGFRCAPSFVLFRKLKSLTTSTGDKQVGNRLSCRQNATLCRVDLMLFLT